MVDHIACNWVAGGQRSTSEGVGSAFRVGRHPPSVGSPQILMRWRALHGSRALAHHHEARHHGWRQWTVAAGQKARQASNDALLTSNPSPLARRGRVTESVAMRTLDPVKACPGGTVVDCGTCAAAVVTAQLTDS